MNTPKIKQGKSGKIKSGKTKQQKNSRNKANSPDKSTLKTIPKDAKKKQISQSETELSEDDLTIHDSDSDVEESFQHLRL